MSLSELQVELRHFAVERDWQPFHTLKNLTTALMVESAELAEIFQWMTPEASRLAHQDPAAKQRIGEEVADVLLYLLQVADHSEIDLEQAVKQAPAKKAAAKKGPASASGDERCTSEAGTGNEGGAGEFGCREANRPSGCEGCRDDGHRRRDQPGFGGGIGAACALVDRVRG